MNSFKTISYNSNTQTLTINGVDYEIFSSGSSFTCGSFSLLRIIGNTLKIDSNEISLTIYS